MYASVPYVPLTDAGFPPRTPLSALPLVSANQVCHFTVFAIRESRIADRAANEACGVVISTGRCNDITGETTNADFTAVVAADQSTNRIRLIGTYLSGFYLRVDHVGIFDDTCDAADECAVTIDMFPDPEFVSTTVSRMDALAA